MWVESDFCVPPQSLHHLLDLTARSRQNAAGQFFDRLSWAMGAGAAVQRTDYSLGLLCHPLLRYEKSSLSKLNVGQSKMQTQHMKVKPKRSGNA